MNSTTLSVTNKTEKRQNCQKNKTIYKKMYGQYKTVDKIY